MTASPSFQDKTALLKILRATELCVSTRPHFRNGFRNFRHYHRFSVRSHNKHSLKFLPPPISISLSSFLPSLSFTFIPTVSLLSSSRGNSPTTTLHRLQDTSNHHLLHASVTAYSELHQVKRQVCLALLSPVQQRWCDREEIDRHVSLFLSLLLVNDF